MTNPPARPKGTRLPKSRKHLRIALLELLETTAYEQINIRDIATKADVGSTTFYRHYPSKEALLNDVALNEITHLSAHTIPVYDARDGQAACVALCAYVHAHRRVWAALLNGGAAGIVRQELLRHGLKDVADRQVNHPTLPRELGLRIAIGSILEVLTWWLQEPAPLPAANVADIIMRISIAPLETAAAAPTPATVKTPPARRRRKPSADRR